eukprot:TRINITY_DN24457_c0_g1_i1.p1 TRINITY_DN24457_c0_g1~~TRINITY_DN24457_c0_g1_i1.p1  ORF type:complete len:111 (+),score=6.03 TRINITY_DN24457_c0_g1_i1:51-383(+)
MKLIAEVMCRKSLSSRRCECALPHLDTVDGRVPLDLIVEFERHVTRKVRSSKSCTVASLMREISYVVNVSSLKTGDLRCLVNTLATHLRHLPAESLSVSMRAVLHTLVAL